MKILNTLAITTVCVALMACAGEDKSAPPATEQPPAPAAAAPTPPAPEPAAAAPSDPLTAVLDAQSDERKARYAYRHPQETLEFFGIVPGMTVMEALPGGGWYSAILVPYLGADGHLIGVDYASELWPNFSFATEEFLERRKGWVNTWPEKAAEWRGESGASVEATRFGEVGEDKAGTVDAALFIRAMHNLNRFEPVGSFRTNALADTLMMLKPGGVVGVVQHSAPAERSDEWADGSRGYLKQQMVIDMFEAAGFEFVAASDVNANPKDVPGEEDIVWRLPPSYNGTKDDPELRAQVDAIGESNRMTLLFRKPVPKVVVPEHPAA